MTPNTIDRIVGLLSLGLMTFAAGDVHSQNLIINPDFEEGNTGFYTDYTYSPWNMLPGGTYAIVDDPHPHHGGATVYGGYGGTGNMLMFNGSSNASDVVWGTLDPLSITTNTDYQFEAWVSSWYDHTIAGALLTFQAKDAQGNWVDLVSVDLGELSLGEWAPVTAVWNSGDATTTELRLINAQTESFGNDFAIDHLSFSQAANVPEATGVLFFGITGIAAILRRRRLN